MVTLKSSKMHVRKLITYTAREKFQPNVMEKSILKLLTTISESLCNNEGNGGRSTPFDIPLHEYWILLVPFHASHFCLFFQYKQSYPFHEQDEAHSDPLSEILS